MGIDTYTSLLLLNHFFLDFIPVCCAYDYVMHTFMCGFMNFCVHLIMIEQELFFCAKNLPFLLRNISDMFAFPFHFDLSKGKPTLPLNFEETTWATLKSAINAIFLKQPDPCDLEKLYQVFFMLLFICVSDIDGSQLLIDHLSLLGGK